MTQEGRKPLDSVRDETPSAEDKPSWDRVASERATGMKLVSPTRTTDSIGSPDSAPAAGEFGHVPTQLDADRNAVPQAPISHDSRPPPAPSSRESDQYLGCTIDNRYKVEALLGEGGMGIVYQCRHKIIDKKVAMKILRGDLAREKEVTDRFLIEAKAASAIGNEHVIDISDFGQLPDGAAYFVMEFLDGQPLSSVLAGNTSLPPARIVHVGLQLAKGLAAAHKAGIVHRDLKPDNIFLITRASDSDFVKVLDFGIAKVSSAATGRLTQAGSVFGTPHYMSPEQAAGAPVDHRGDIYAMGVILYEMATGKLPFEADNFMAILTQHIYKQPATLRTINPNVPPALEAIILKCLSKRPEQRYQSMEEFAADLQRFSSGTMPVAVSEMVARSGGFNVPADFWKQPSTRRDKSPLANRWPILVAALVAAAALGFLVFSDQNQPAPTAQTTLSPVAPPAPEVVPPAAPEQLTITSQVVLAVEPLTAHVFQGENDLGSSPVVVQVPEGTQVDVEVRQEGYKSQTLSLDGSKQKLSIALEPIKQKAPARPTIAPRPPAMEEHKKQRSGQQIGGGEIVNPWAGN